MPVVNNVIAIIKLTPTLTLVLLMLWAPIVAGGYRGPSLYRITIAGPRYSGVSLQKSRLIFLNYEQ